MCIELYVDYLLVYSNCPSTITPSPSSASDENNDIDNLLLTPSAAHINATAITPSTNSSNGSIPFDGITYTYIDPSLTTLGIVMTITFCVLVACLLSAYCCMRKKKKIKPQQPKKKTEKRKCCTCCCCKNENDKKDKLPVNNFTQTN